MSIAVQDLIKAMQRIEKGTDAVACCRVDTRGNLELRATDLVKGKVYGSRYTLTPEDLADHKGDYLEMVSDTIIRNMKQVKKGDRK